MNSFIKESRNIVRSLIQLVILGVMFCYQFATGKSLFIACYANTIDAGLQLNVILDSALTAFKQLLAPLALFSTAFYDVALEGTDKIDVPYYPLETATSKDFTGTYIFDKGTATQKKEITINKRKYQPMSYTSAEARRQPKFDPEKLGQLKGWKLAEDVLVDILSVVTAANFGAAAFTGIASTFDGDDAIELRTKATQAKWPSQGRGIVIDPTYVGELSKDMIAGGGMATYDRDVAGDALNFPRAFGFSWAETNVIPGNGENLVGFSVFQSAIIVGFSPVEPVAEVRELLSDYQIVTDTDTGISLEYRQWGDADTDTAKRTIECNYGYAPGEAAALQRIVSA